MKLMELSTGDSVHHYEKSVIICFKGPRKVLSTSIYNGGYREDLQAVFNYDCKLGAGMGCEMLAPTYREHMELVAARLGLIPQLTTGMGTAADMENLAVVRESYQELQVTALVTGGIETNGGRAGDPADYYRPIEKPDLHGTINIMLLIDCDMPVGTLTRALVTCTEAKTAAIQELLAGSNYSTGLATGSGTDQTIIIANSESSLYLEGSGKHAKMGELIGRAVKAAVKEALSRQSGLNPQRQHDAFRRGKRYGLTMQGLWLAYRERGGQEQKPGFIARLEQLARDKVLLPKTSLYLHLLDQLEWQLLSEQEVQQEAQQLLQAIALHYGVAAVAVQEGRVEAALAAWKEQVLAIMLKNT